MPPDPIFQAYLRFLHETNMSDPQLATAIGVAHHTAMRWGHGLHAPRPNSLKKIEAFLRKYGSEYLGNDRDRISRQ